MNPLLKGFKSSTRPRERGTPWEWCERHLYVDRTSPFPGRWRSDTSPWVKELMEVFADNHVNDIAVKCSAQSSKTQTILNCACWAIAEDNGPSMWVMANKEDAASFSRDRVNYTFSNCRPVAVKLQNESKLEYVFDGVPFYFVGAGSPSKLQSKPIRWLLLDEVRNYPPGALSTVLKRTRSFWNTRRVVISTPDKEGDEVDLAYSAGDQRVWHFPCPHCGQLQPLIFEQLKWTKDERTKPEGKWNYDALAETIRYVCPACGHQIKDTPTERKHLTRKGAFVRMNPRAPRHRVSFHWNALLPTWVSWRSIVEEFLNARLAMRYGDINPLKTFINETLGLSWQDRLGELDDFDYLESRREAYDFGDPWPSETVRFMAADKQAAGGEHYFWVVRAFNAIGHSRLVSYGKCDTFSQLETIRQEYAVKPANCVIDSGYKASEVYKFCGAFRWKPFKGDDQEFFAHKNPVTGKVYRRLWQLTRVDPLLGKRRYGTPTMALYRWSNPGVKDLLGLFTAGLNPGWSLSQHTGKDYLLQMSAERREEIVDARGRSKWVWKQIRRDNHYLDCELMILTAALINGLVKHGPA